MNHDERAFLRTVLLFTLGYAIMMGFVAVSEGKTLGGQYTAQGGGDDGFTHDAYGRRMAMHLANWDWYDALQGGEPVYWTTPGMRYFRMVEKLIFGDTNHLYALVVASTPVLWWLLCRHVAGEGGAWLLTCVWFALPAGHVSYLNLLTNAKLGYGEAVAVALYLTALVLILQSEPRWGGTGRPAGQLWIAGVCLAGSLFIRPNFAYAVAWLALASSWARWQHRDYRSIAALASGCALALWMPFHNWYFGGAFYLISKSGATVSVPFSLRDYVIAAGELLQGQATDHRHLMAEQLQGWLWNPGVLVRPWVEPLAWPLQIVSLGTLAVTVWRVLWPARDATARTLRLIGVAALAAHAPLLVIFSTHYRYAMLGWFLCALVTIGVCAEYYPRWIREMALRCPAPLDNLFGHWYFRVR